MNNVVKLVLIQVVMAISGAAAAQSEVPGEIVNDRISFNTWDTTTYVFTVGEIQNTSSDATLDDLIVEVRFFDTDGVLIDVIVESLYQIRVLPGEKVAFKLQSLAATKQSDYSSHEVRLVAAHEDRPCPHPATSQPKEYSGLFMKLLISSFPILLLIGVWIYFMRRYSGKGSPQDRSLDLVEKQNEMIREQGKALDRIAKAMESKDND